jgi:transglutaminase-like putative cysteine protease
MKRLVLLLVMLSASFSSFGYSRITLERVWTISTDGSPYDFTGALAVNNSNQKIISITISPQAEHYTDANNTVWVHAKGSGQQTVVIRAKAVIDVGYDTNITKDSPIPLKDVQTTNLTEFDQAISTQAVKLSKADSSLLSIANMVNWVHDYVEYDLDYWGRIRSARQVFTEKRGVCVEYTHLLLSLVRSLGFEARYVNGYVKANNWQPHAWTEIFVPEYGWLPADPTFGQVGTLDNTHVAINYGLDQASAFDLLVTQDPEARIEVSGKVSENFLSEDQKGVNIGLDFQAKDSYAEVKLTNTRPDFVFGSYLFYAPGGSGQINSSVVLLPPLQTTYRYHVVNYSLFEQGYLSDIPLSASFNDAKDSLTISPIGSAKPLKAPEYCLSAIMLLAVVALMKAT